MRIALFLLAFFPVLSALGDPSRALMIFEGIDTTSKERCHLFVLAVQQNSSGLQSLVVTTGYGHDHDRPQALTLVPQSSQVFMGSANGGQDQLALFLGTPFDLRSARNFNFKWWHVNHAHTFQCARLRQIK
ncbi:MAG: hypothetical protein KF789_01715 [Bdellovibrionaceae bacterium]|nr:hypothetical protein [Pseudobdellovibrionaceae bacterium]